jgi:hypothetical protein
VRLNCRLLNVDSACIGRLITGVIEMKKIEKKDSNYTQNFNLVFRVVLTLTVICLLISTLVASLFPNPSTLQISLFETCSSSWKIGFGAIVALIGVKASGESNSS